MRSAPPTPGHTATTIARGLAWVAVAIVLLLAAFLVYLRPWLLLFLAAGAILGGVPGLVRRVGTKRVAIACGIVVALVVAIPLSSGPNVQFSAPPRASGIEAATYFADLTYVATGDWSGTERFDITREQAFAFAGAGPEKLVDRLAAALPAGWTAKRLGGTRFRLGHAFDAEPFDVPDTKPLIRSTDVRIEPLRQKAPQSSLFPRAGSIVMVHAPSTRIHATTPTSSPKPEGGSMSVRKLVLDGDEGTTVVTIDVKSDLAAQLPDAWLAPTFGAVLGAVFSTLGLSALAAGGWVVRAGRWLLGRAAEPPAPRSEWVLGGQSDKSAALYAYLAQRGLSGERAASEVAVAAHEARKLAREVLEVAAAKDIQSRYARAFASLAAKGMSELDAVYEALRTAGVSQGELRWLDAQLDEFIIDRHEGAASTAHAT